MLASKAERKIHDIFIKNHVRFIEEYTFSDLTTKSGTPLRFDFAVFDKRGRLLFLLEMNGKQHYVPVDKFGGAQAFKRQKYNDARKREYCAKRKIKLVIIPYYEEEFLSLAFIEKKANIPLGGENGKR